MALEANSAIEEGIYGHVKLCQLVQHAEVCEWFGTERHEAPTSLARCKGAVQLKSSGVVLHVLLLLCYGVRSTTAIRMVLRVQEPTELSPA